MVAIPDSEASDEHGPPLCDECFDGTHATDHAEAAYCGECGTTHAGACVAGCTDETHDVDDEGQCDSPTCSSKGWA